MYSTCSVPISSYSSVMATPAPPPAARFFSSSNGSGAFPFSLRVHFTSENSGQSYRAKKIWTGFPSIEAKATTRREGRVARHERVRKKVHGTPERPRMCVFRSNKHLYVQVIDDTKMHTLAAASTMQKPVIEEVDFSAGPTIGASKNINLMEWDKLWTINKKIIDPICPRHTAVLEERRVIFTLTNEPKKPYVSILPRHKKFVGAGMKATTHTNRIWLDYTDASTVSEGEEVTLMDWGNAIITEINKENGSVTHLFGVLHLEGSVKTTKLKLTWLPDTDELINLSLVEFDYLLKKKKLEEGEDFLDNLNSCTRRESAALGDSNMRNLKRGDVIQLERKGYFRCDVPFVRPSKRMVLFAIPDGRQTTSLN